MTPLPGAPRELSVLISDDLSLYRDGLRDLVADIPNITNIGEAANSSELIQQLKYTNWNLILLDIQMLEQGGLEALTHIGNMSNPPMVIALSQRTCPLQLRDLFSQGIKGYLLKESPAHEIKAAILAVIGGKTHYSDEIYRILLEGFHGTEPLLAPHKNFFTKREMEVLRLICDEKTGLEISQELHLSEETIKRYRSILLQKTNARNMVGLVKYAIKNGFYQ